MMERLNHLNELIDKEHTRRAKGEGPNFLSVLARARRRYRSEIRIQKRTEKTMEEYMNNVALIGRLTRDPELRFIAGSSTPVTQFTLAVDKNLSKAKRQRFESQNKPTTDFIRIVVWGKQAENCANHLEKGRRVAIQGSISVTSYKSNTGETRYNTDVVASYVEFLGQGEKGKDNGGQLAQSFDDDFANDFRAIESDEDIPF